MAAVLQMPRLFLSGRARAGWCCWTCHAEHPHHGAPIRTFTRLTRHALSAHHRLPQGSLATACVMHGDYVWHQTSPFTFTWSQP